MEPIDNKPLFLYTLAIKVIVKFKLYSIGPELDLYTLKLISF